MRIITRGWAVLALLCSFMLAAGVLRAQDAPYQDPIGTESSWDLSGSSIMKFEDREFDIRYAGAAAFETVGNDPVDEFRASTQLDVLSIEGAGYDERAGSVTWRADIERTKAAGLLSTITANQESGAFPALGRIEFYAEVSVIASEGNDEVIYRSEQPVVLVSDDINDWPMDQLSYHQQGEAIFTRVDDPNQVLVVRDLNTTVVIIPNPSKPCQDPCCQTDALSLNTGYNHAASNIYAVGSNDAYWKIVGDENTGRPTPRAARVISSIWGTPQPNTQWIGPNATALDNFIGRVTYQKCFCMCQASDVTFNLSILVDDQASIYLDGALVGSTPDLAFSTPTKLAFTRKLSAGTHCIEVVVRNNYLSHSGLNIQGTVQGRGLLKFNCCGSSVPDPDPCHTSLLTLATNSTWTLISGPPKSGSYPRCASIIPKPSTAWGAPIAGTNWIGPNSNGTSVSGPQNTYIYRKCFCVAAAGVYTISITTMADDKVDVSLNGVNLFTHASYKTPVTKTFVIALAAGCNCFDFKVQDLGYAITGLDALIKIQGGTLLKESCCACASCNSGFPPSSPPDNPPSGLSQKVETGGDAESYRVMALAPRPMLLSLPDEKTGAPVVHYVMDKEANAEVALINMAGERVQVLDQGTRTQGAHSVPLATKGLAPGSYNIQFVYGGETLSVPFNVQ